MAPLQLKANNGVLVIDDFGRQAMSPDALLNRWIVPLDRGIDYLTLDNGLKFELPCLTKIVFSTNMEPASLADEAFFRKYQSLDNGVKQQLQEILSVLDKKAGS